MQPLTSCSRKSPGEKVSCLWCPVLFVLSNSTLGVEGGVLTMQPSHRGKVAPEKRGKVWEVWSLLANASESQEDKGGGY